MKNGGQSFQLSWTTTIHDRIATVAAHAHTRVLNNPARHNTHAVYHNGGHDRSGSCDLQRASTSASSPGTFGAKLLMTQSQGKPSQPARKYSFRVFIARHPGDTSPQRKIIQKFKIPLLLIKKTGEK